jgi:hypothetical protein
MIKQILFLVGEEEKEKLIKMQIMLFQSLPVLHIKLETNFCFLFFLIKSVHFYWCINETSFLFFCEIEEGILCGNEWIVGAGFTGGNL